MSSADESDMSDSSTRSLSPVPMTYRERLAHFRQVEEERAAHFRALEEERLARSRALEEKKHDLIEELLEKLDRAEARLAQTELDLQSETNVRRRLQSEVSDAQAREEALSRQQSQRPFVLVLLDADADGYLFQDKYITRKASGGEALADELLIRTREYLRPQFEDADSLDIIVRIYANLEGMANYLVRLDKVRNLGQLRAFSTGFCGRISSFDWVDIGVAKEGGAGRKVRENLSFYTSNSHLRHIIVGCSPMDLPNSLLSTIPLEKLTLIETTPLPASLTSLPIRVTRFPTLFMPPPILKTNKIRDRDSIRGSGPQLQLMPSEDDNGGSTWLVIQPERSKSQPRSRRRNGSEEGSESLSISIGPDNTVSVDSGRRRRIMN